MTITCGEARLSATAEKPETFFLRRVVVSHLRRFAFRRVGSCDWFGEGRCLDWHCPYSPFRSYLFLLAARGCLRRQPAAPTPVPPAPSGPAGAPCPPRSMGGPSHFLQRAAHRDAFVSCTLEEEAAVRLSIRTLFNPQTQKKKEKKTLHRPLFLLLLHNLHLHFLLSISHSAGMLWKSFQRLPQSGDQTCL